LWFQLYLNRIQNVRKRTQKMNDTKLSLGVSICLDMSRSRVLISTVSKSRSRQPRKSQQFQKPSLDRILIFQCPKISICLDSQHDLDLDSRSRQFSKSVETCRDVSISISIGLDCRDPQAYNKTKSHFVLCLFSNFLAKILVLLLGG
jgi:hypothetical protein